MWRAGVNGVLPVIVLMENPPPRLPVTMSFFDILRMSDPRKRLVVCWLRGAQQVSNCLIAK
jgi:hypothetical protein